MKALSRAKTTIIGVVLSLMVALSAMQLVQWAMNGRKKAMHSISDRPSSANGSGQAVMKWFTGVNSYIIGLVISVILTVLAYVLVSFSASIWLILSLFLLAILQLITQLVFFIHLGQESPARWNIILFLSACVGILMVVVSSIWIMANLNYHMPR